MKTLAERVKTAREALKEKTSGIYTQAYVARAVGLEQQSYADIETGKSKRPRNIEKLATILQTTPAWLQFGTGTAPTYLPIEEIPADHVPVLPLHLVKEWLKEHDLIPLALKAEIQFIGNPLKTKGREFAVRVENDAMTSPLPGARSFQKGDTIIIDPEKMPEEGSFIVAVKKGSDEAIFSQYTSYAGNIFLKPLNPQYPTIAVDKTIKICGVVVVRMDFL